MPSKSLSVPEEKNILHARNKHRSRYDFSELVKSCPELSPFVLLNDFNELTVDFQNPEAVKTLNKALLAHFYGIKHWDIPAGYLCPPVPGRADHVHYIADLLAGPEGEIPRGKSVKVLDIGVGANCIYPLIGVKEYGWTFVGSEIDPFAYRFAENIVEANSLSKAIRIRKQKSSSHILEGAIYPGETFALTMCNPPFHNSAKEAAAGAERKWKQLGKKPNTDILNFGGMNAELWCEGGEERFVRQMIEESVHFSKTCLWFTSLISKKETLPGCLHKLKLVGAAEVRTIDMAQGHKISRLLAWTFMDKQAQQNWKELYIKNQ